MVFDEIIEKFLARMKRLISFLPSKKRLYFKELKKHFESRAIMLYGARGVGKTTFLLNLAKDKDFIYLSADDPILYTVGVYELFQHILMQYEGVIIDEVHFLKNWSVLLKALYDAFPDKTIWVSSSSSVLLRKGIADLSRRFVPVKLPLMSFREFVYFETGVEFDRLEDPFGDKREDYALKVLRDIDVLKLFREYKEKGTRSFYVEGDFKERMKAILEKTIYHDIPYLAGPLGGNHFGVIKAIVSYLIYSKIPVINIEAICREWGVSKQKFYKLLSIMEEIELLNIVRKSSVEKPYSKGSKIFLSDPVMYSVFDGEVGNFREAYVVFSLKEIGKIFASKNEKNADFIFEGIKIEVGGKSKKRKDADFVIRDDIDVPVKNAVPMWMLGMLW